MDLLKDSLGSPSLKIFVNNINKYGLMIFISPSSVVSFALFIAVGHERTLSFFLLIHTNGISEPFGMFSRGAVSVK